LFEVLIIIGGMSAWFYIIFHGPTMKMLRRRWRLAHELHDLPEPSFDGEENFLVPETSDQPASRYRRKSDASGVEL
jgi:hypothetical protein